MRHKLYEKDGRLKRVYAKYPDIIEYVVLEGSREYCLFIEKHLRPLPRMGWNLTEGGGDPPNQKGKIMSETQKRNIGKANSGVNGPKWKGWWIVDGVRYDTTIDVAKVYGVTTKTVCDRAKNPKFPNWTFELKIKEKDVDDYALQRLSN